MTKKATPTEWNTLSQAAVARMLGLTTARVGQLIEERRLAAHRVKGWARPRVLLADAERFKRQRERQST